MIENQSVLIILGVMFISVVGLSIFYCVMAHIDKKSDREAEEERRKKMRSLPQVLTTMSYTSIMEIIDKMIHFEVSNTILKNGLRNKTEEELSVILDNHILTISESVYTSISNSLLTVVQYYITDNYLKKYIKDTTRIILVANLMSSVGNISSES